MQCSRLPSLGSGMLTCGLELKTRLKRTSPLPGRFFRSWAPQLTDSMRTYPNVGLKTREHLTSPLIGRFFCSLSFEFLTQFLVAYALGCFGLGLVQVVFWACVVEAWFSAVREFVVGCGFVLADDRDLASFLQSGACAA